MSMKFEIPQLGIWRFDRLACCECTTKKSRLGFLEQAGVTFDRAAEPGKLRVVAG